LLTKQDQEKRDHEEILTVIEVLEEETATEVVVDSKETEVPEVEVQDQTVGKLI
jgi:hypothetical protein